MERANPGCLSVEEAENLIHTHEELSYKVALTHHAKERIEERGIIMSDALYILKHGHIYDEPHESSRPGYCKYKICSKSPNSGNREICLIVIPDPDEPAIKIITVMWKDL